jgi:hypothetical protein
MTNSGDVKTITVSGMQFGNSFSQIAISQLSLTLTCLTKNLKGGLSYEKVNEIKWQSFPGHSIFV